MPHNAHIFGLEIKALPANGKTVQRVNREKRGCMNATLEMEEAEKDTKTGGVMTREHKQTLNNSDTVAKP